MIKLGDQVYLRIPDSSRKEFRPMYRLVPYIRNIKKPNSDPFRLINVLWLASYLGYIYNKLIYD